MRYITDNFGLSRVVEPRNTVPVTAWKLDNSREIGANECRVSVTLIHLERDNFQQLCSEYGYDEARIKAKILELISRRGKLHNPFTGSSGQLYGVIEEMGSEYAKQSPYKVGDEIFCITTLTALPIKLEAIHEVGFNYGELKVSGYAILFLGSPVTIIPPELALNYTISAFDEAGSLYSVCEMAGRHKRFLIIGKDLVSCVIYAGTIRMSAQDAYITAILDEESEITLSPKQVRETLAEWADSIYVEDVGKPMTLANQVLQEEGQWYDMTINCEDLTGAEALSIMLTRNKGQVYFTGIKNSYIQAILIAESMGKEIQTHALDQFLEGYASFNFQLLGRMKGSLDRINRLYEEAVKSGKGRQKRLLSGSLEKSGKRDDFVYESPVTEALLDETLNIAAYDCNLIIQGETGTGKEKILELIHKNSARRGKPCVKINCATIQESLAESEFFGYEPGAFTGAQSSGKKGYFEVANGGILFLDEVGTLPLGLQSKLLRVLQENQFYRVGGTAPIDINVRVICANNVPLKQLAAAGKFREDLYYRLNICTIQVPPLRERREDIGALARMFMETLSHRYGADKELTADAIGRLMDYHWPGNVRELENFMHRLFISVRGYIISRDDVEEMLGESIYEELVLDVKAGMRNAESLDFNEVIARQEVQMIEYALKKCGTTRRAAEFLHMTQAQLVRKKQKYGL